jgi:erythrocyte band 7 integral membrane protein
VEPGISSISHETILLQEYERAVIFRLGLLLSGGARGPGVFFIIPCVDIYEKIDMRTQTFDVPPQEVSWNVFQR